MIFFKNYGCTIIFVKISRCKCTHPNYTPGLTKVGGEDQSSCILTVCQECWVISLAGPSLKWVPWHPLRFCNSCQTPILNIYNLGGFRVKNESVTTKTLPGTPLIKTLARSLLRIDIKEEIKNFLEFYNFSTKTLFRKQDATFFLLQKKV